MTSSNGARRRRSTPEGQEVPDITGLQAALVSHAPDYLFVLDRSARVEFVNRRESPLATTPCSGAHAAEWIGLAPEVIEAAVARVIESGAEERHEFPVRDSSERERWYCARMRAFAPTQAEPRVLAFVSEITERHQAEGALRKTVRELEESRRQILQAQKMESIGRLAGGVAHDFNNLLTAIISFSRFVMDDLAPGDPRRSDLGEVLKAADSAAKLTSQLLAFSRKRPVEPTLMDLSASVVRISRVLRRTLEESIHLCIVEADGPVPVMFDPGQLDQLVMNLSINARDAMPDGGTLTLEIARRTVSGHAELAPGEYATFTVADTGTGMSEDVMSQVFEPFFTTKGEKGTGLGLATCYGIAKQGAGHIDVQSRLHVGSSFTVFLPLARGGEARPEVARPSLHPDELPARLSGLALVVEDQSAIRTTMRRSLEGVGFNVIEAKTAEEALAIVHDLDARVDLLVTDVVLPGLNGIKLADRLRERQPGLRVLVCSGYTGHEQDTGIALNARTAFLAKPFTGPQLASKASGLFG